jgi:hypothetical protein
MRSLEVISNQLQSSQVESMESSSSAIQPSLFNFFTQGRRVWGEISKRGGEPLHSNQLDDHKYRCESYPSSNLVLDKTTGGMNMGVGVGDEELRLYLDRKVQIWPMWRYTR